LDNNSRLTSLPSLRTTSELGKKKGIYMRHSLNLIVAIALSGVLAACSNNTAEIAKMDASAVLLNVVG
jgi:hypothetical protein